MQLDDPRIREALDDDGDGAGGAGKPEQLPRMSFGDHLDELRKRVIRSLLAIGIAILAVLPFKQEVTEILIEPYRVQWRIGFENWIEQLQEEKARGELDDLGEGFLAFSLENKDKILAGGFRWDYLLERMSGYPVPYSLYATGGLEDMLAFMWFSLIFALAIASPVVVWQAWAFVAAGLYKHERAVFYRYFPLMVVLVCAGVWFGYRIALPFSLGFLVSLMDPSQVKAIFSIGQFLTLEFTLTAAMGVMFQLPLIMLALQKVGLVRHRAFVKHWRVTVLVIFCCSALFTPPEPVSMILMAAPMMLLYLFGLLLTWRASKHEQALPEAS
ncbi:MAG TPA: preprotein translocase subunit TatC [bacterium]|nr:preprotein translocase subunit TatC [bacterium]